ncbi:SDR family oxidoreductase [Streptomyces sp. NPDC097610]|uniref:SDR family NAD(P)-dependent oxidoreductase n=1 Tax=Streptomyces sp. NPDC097610 TaxID=3157227 RepID=UPI00331CB0B1
MSQEAARGASVAVGDLNLEGAEKTASVIQEAGGVAIAVGGDAADAAVAGAAALIRRELGSVAILVNKAGVTACQPLVSMGEDAWDRMIGINLKGPFLVTRELVPDDTPLARQGPVDIGAAAAHLPMKRAGRPEDVAYAVAYLASEEAGYVTGQTLGTNGGRHLV